MRLQFLSVVSQNETDGCECVCVWKKATKKLLTAQHDTANIRFNSGRKRQMFGVCVSVTALIQL